MIKPLEIAAIREMTESDWRVHVAAEGERIEERLLRIETRQKFNLKILLGILSIVGIAALNQLMGFLLSGGLRIAP